MCLSALRRRIFSASPGKVAGNLVVHELEKKEISITQTLQNDLVTISALRLTVILQFILLCWPACKNINQ